MKNVQTDSNSFSMTGPKGKPFFLLLLLAAAAVFFVCFSPAGEKTVVAKIVQAYGGRDALSRVSSLAAEGKITTLMPKDEGAYVRYLKRNRKLLVDIKYTKRTEKRILNGDRGYSGTDEAVTEVTGPPYDAMVYQYNQLDLPYGLIDGTFTVKGVRKDSVRGKPVEVLKLTDRTGNEMEVAVDGENYHILKITGTFGIGRERASLSAEFGDFRKVDGILLPFSIVNYADDFKISETRIIKYMINADIKDTIFSP